MHSTHKCPRVDSSVSYPSSFSVCTQGKTCSGTHRQQGNGLLYQSSGKHMVTECTSSCSQTACLGSDQPAFHSGSVSARPTQSGRGCSLMWQGVTGRLDSTPRSGADDMEDLWDCSGKCVRRQSNVSLRDEPGSLGLDALAHDWPDRIIYAFPLLPLIWRTRVSSARMQPSSAVSSSTLACKTMVSDTSLTDSRTTLPSAQQTRPTESVRRESLTPTPGPIETLGVATGPTGAFLEVFTEGQEQCSCCIHTKVVCL